MDVYSKFAVALALAVTASAACSSAVEAIDAGSLTECLNGKEATMYGLTGCGWCSKQMEIFGSRAGDIDVVFCDQSSLRSGECAAFGIQATPTWRIGNRNYAGYKDADQLFKMAGCGLKPGHWMTSAGGICTAFPEQLPVGSYIIEEVA